MRELVRLAQVREARAKQEMAALLAERAAVFDTDTARGARRQQQQGLLVHPQPGQAEPQEPSPARSMQQAEREGPETPHAQQVLQAPEAQQVQRVQQAHRADRRHRRAQEVALRARRRRRQRPTRHAASSAREAAPPLGFDEMSMSIRHVL